MCYAVACFAQVKPAGTPQAVPEPKVYPKPTNVRVMDEYNDGKGNMIRTIQYEQNHMRITETIIKPIGPPAVKVNLHREIKGDTLIKDSVQIVVSKSKYRVDVFYKRQMIRSYIAVFGPRPLENKCMEGDRCTPEGTFKIQLKNPASQYNKCMLLDYPNDSARKRFTALKEKGSIPQTARIGGNVGIHGIWKGGDDMIELGVGWTDGCIALRNRDVDELYTFAGVGTKVVIKK
ncbi:MAG: L,D-transpeptidase [Taibaiella sp.]|nr:L,D-transpeptidase [Taibaiella sp.]